MSVWGKVQDVAVSSMNVNVTLQNMVLKWKLECTFSHSCCTNIYEMKKITILLERLNCPEHEYCKFNSRLERTFSIDYSTLNENTIDVVRAYVSKL